MSIIPHGEEPRICAASRTTRAPGGSSSFETRQRVHAKRGPMINSDASQDEAIKKPAEVPAGFRSQRRDQILRPVSQIHWIPCDGSAARNRPRSAREPCARRRLVDIYALTIAIGRAAGGDGTPRWRRRSVRPQRCGDAALCDLRASWPATSDRCGPRRGQQMFLHVLGSPEMALSVSTGFKMTHTLYSEAGRSPKRHNQSNPTSSSLVVRKKGF